MFFLSSINSLGGFKYIFKKTSYPRDNTSSYNKMKNFNNFDTMLLKNKLNPSTSAVESNTVAIFSKRIYEKESSFYSETTRNIKCQRKLNRSEE